MTRNKGDHKAHVIIPARGGSKRVPRKNIKDFHGKPIIAYTIEACVNCPAIDKIIVSTDDAEIAEISRKFGAWVPFTRPDELSGDFTGTVEVISHAVKWLEQNDISTKYTLCAYPTAPFLSPDDLLTSFEEMRCYAGDYIFSATAFSYPIQRAVNKLGAMFFPEEEKTRSQDLEPAFHDAGQFYWGKSSSFLDRKPILNSIGKPYVLPRERCLDIDTIEDWNYAELMYEVLQTKSR